MENNKKRLNVLVACEESQRVCSEFRKLGHNAYSCDLLKCSGGHPEWHFNQDVLEVIKNKGGTLQNGEKIKIDGNWDIMIAHPPCTYLAVSGAKWFYHPEDKDLPIEKRRPHPRFPNRVQDREEGAKFFLELANSDIKYIAVENPIGIMSKRYRKPDQIIQPWMFGHPTTKATCLWLKGLPNLEPTNIVEVDTSDVYSYVAKNGHIKHDSRSRSNCKKSERAKFRSKTFLGIAEAMAEQWG